MWKPIEGFEGKYLISEFGEIKSIERNIGNGTGYIHKERIRKPVFDSDKYYQVSLPIQDRKTKSFKIHRLVVHHFVQKVNKNDVICHKDGNKLNNHYSNLYTGDHKSNTLDRYKHGSTKLSIAQIYEIRNLAGYMPQYKIGIIYNITQGSVSRIINKVRANYIN